MLTPCKKSSEAVLLLAHGGPSSLDDVKPFLANILGNRLTPEIALTIEERYRRVGGKSPLLAITRSLAQKLSESIQLPVYVGMKYWDPLIEDTLRQMERDGVERYTAICLAPHFSELSIGGYRKRLTSGMGCRFVRSWHDLASFIDATTLTLSPSPALREREVLLFTAHSLPISALGSGDPYVEQLLQTCRLVAERLGLSREQWVLGFQSASKTDSTWLSPHVEHLIPELAQKGVKEIVLSPIGFVAEHIEILYDIDVLFQEIAYKNGISLTRTPMLNDRPEMVDILRACIDFAATCPYESVQ